MLAPDGNTIVEGRNRFIACGKAGVDPTFRTLAKSYDDVNIIDFIRDANLQRRDLSVGQRAAIMLSLNERKEKALADAAKEKQREHGKTAPGRKSLAPTLGQVNRRNRTDRKLAKDIGVGHGTIWRSPFRQARYRGVVY